MIKSQLEFQNVVEVCKTDNSYLRMREMFLTKDSVPKYKENYCMLS